MGKTSIEWTDCAWPVITGCTRVSEGCRNCYSERLTATRLKNVPAYKGLAEMKHGDPRWTGEVRLNHKVLEDPLHWKKPRRIFVSQMSDLFHEAVPNEFIDKCFAVMALASRHQFQVLTKRPSRMRLYMARLGSSVKILDVAARSLGYTFEFQGRYLACWPLPNVHLGVSVEDQETADERIPLLLQTPAAVRFISAEPLLGPIDVSEWTDVCGYYCDHQIDPESGAIYGHRPELQKQLHWIIVGGESGPKARPCNLEWIRSIVAQCKAAGVPCFVKQLGSNPRTNAIRGYDDAMERIALKHRKGGDIEEFPHDLRVREFPHVK